MAGQGILKIEQAEVPPSGNDHQIVGVKVAQDEHRLVLNDCQDIRPTFSPSLKESLLIDIQSEGRCVPFGE
jgi:hypothetical protein